MATPIRHRIELYTMRELHLELLLSSCELLNPLGKPSRLAGLEVSGLFGGVEVGELVRIRLALVLALAAILAVVPVSVLFLSVGAR